MEEALPFLGTHGALEGGEHLLEFHGDEKGVYHAALGPAGVDAGAVDGDFGVAGVEVLGLDFADGAAVQCIGLGGAEVFDIEAVGAAANLLVGRKAHVDVAVGDFRVLHQVFHGTEDFGDACLVVCA